MRRHSGQKALYEAMSRPRSKPRRPGLLQRLRPQLEKLRKAGAATVKRSLSRPEPAAEKPGPMVLKPPKPREASEPAAQSPVQTWLRPKAVQFNAGRIELTLPYQIGIIIGLGLTLLVLIAFWFGHRLGQIDQRARYGRASQSAGAGASSLPTNAVESEEDVKDSGPSTTADPGTTAPGATATGNNLIVLARHRLETQLAPVQVYFRDHGIETRIVSYEQVRTVLAQYGLDTSHLPQGDGFVLVTNNLYDNPERE
ncbi:MAG: hypothetical protein ACYTAS_16850, partial [Planctomycetota bacterium]